MYRLIFIFLRGYLLAMCLFASISGYAVDSDVIINEILYYPDSDFQKEELIEIYNRGDETVDLSGWAFSRGVTFLFPEGTKIAAKGYAVIAREASFIKTVAKNALVLGNFEGQLADRGETLTLYNTQGEIADSVHYQDAPPWPTSPDGSGASLERISPWESSSDPANWAGAQSGLAGIAAGKFGSMITPGQINSVYSENLPPTIQQVVWNPECPKPNSTVTLQARITDTDGVHAVEVHYQPVSMKLTNVEERVLEMQMISGTPQDATWEVTLPKHSDRTFVRFWLKAADLFGTERIYPAPTEARKTLTYFHYADDETSTIPIVFLYDFGGTDNPNAFRSDSAFVIRYPGKEGWEVYDYINTTRRTRSGDGHDIRFLKHYELEDMSSINVSFEPKPRYALSEWLSYQVYQSLGVICGKASHYRFNRNDQDFGYYLMYEQPNKHFIARNGLDNSGNLYKIFWSHDRNTSAAHIAELHQKRTNLSQGKEDIIETVQTLHTLTGRAQTLFIESYFAVDQLIDCFIGGQLISDWDGYFNNHYVYHDTEGSGLWYIFPWDKDKTWGDSDAYQNILPYYDFYDMPILYGAYGTPRSGKDSGTWWRNPGYFSGPILSNADMQLRYLYRLGYVASHEFSTERWIPIIDELEKRLEPEIRHKAQITQSNVNSALDQFHTEIESFRRQVINRPVFIMAELEKLIGPVTVSHWSLY